MFKHLFYYWLNPTDTPSIEAKYNLWSYLNIKIFKLKVTSQITYYILGLNNLYLKELKIFYKNISFEYFYVKLLTYLILTCVLLSIIIL